jgi:drug/metabolite transporter (DMT)-like permease
MREQSQHARLATAAGIVVILLWSSTFGIVRSLTEQVGTLTTGAASCLLGGATGLAIFLIPARRRARMRALSWRKQVGRGAFFVAYEVCLFLAVGLAADRQAVVRVAVINYLWPGLTLLLAVPILHRRAKWTLAPGMLLAFAGVALAATRQEGLTLADLGRDGTGLPCLLALVAAVSWALYNNLSRRWAETDDHLAVPLFVSATGAILAASAVLAGHGGTWTARAAIELAYLAAFPTLVAFLLWNHAIGRGNVVVVASLSYLTPLLATTFACVYLRVLPGAGVWIAVGMVVAGAATCRLSVGEPARR